MHLSRQAPATWGLQEDAAPRAILTPLWGTPTGIPPVWLTSAARACIQTKHFEEVLSK